MGKKHKAKEASDFDLVETDAERVEEWIDAHQTKGGWVEADRQDESKHELAEDAHAEGDREEALQAEATEELAPLRLSPETRKEQRGKLGLFEDAYNIYCAPMGMTLRAIGRVQDLLSAGAPSSPKELGKKEKKAFGKAKDKEERKDRKRTLKAWEKERLETGSDYEDAQGLLEELFAAQKTWQGMKLLLEQRTLEKRRDAADAERKRLDAIVDLATGFVDVIRDTISAYKGTAKDGKPWDHVKLPGFSINDGIRTLVYELGDMDQLNSMIAHLDGEITKLGIEREGLDVRAAQQAVSGIARQAKAAGDRLGEDRNDMRDAAADFADEIGGGEDVMLAVLAAEAYQELALYGDDALEAAKQAKAFVPAVGKYVAENASEVKIHRRAKQEGDVHHPLAFATDPVEADRARRGVQAYGGLLTRELDDWKVKEAAWRKYFSSHT